MYNPHEQICTVVFDLFPNFRWSFGEPQGQRLENCMATGVEKSEDSGFFDIGCDHRDYCSLCNFKKVPRLSRRGGCPESHIDAQYVLIFDETHDGFSKLIGSSVSEIRFTASRPGWEVFDVAREVVLAYTELQQGDIPDYPIGLPVFN